MIAEKNLSNESNPQISIPNANIVSLIIKIMKQTLPIFRTHLDYGFHNKKKLNEDDFTQIYIEQIQIQIRNYDYPFNVSVQYRDITNQSKGISDFYFYPNEQNVSTTSFFSVESKRLPSPEKSREREYIIGNKNNGGIERYKTEKHGKGLYDCGLLGFIENGSFKHWEVKINNWIKELAKIDEYWNNDEILSEAESNTDFCFLKSIAHRKNDNIHLAHLWVKLS